MQICILRFDGSHTAEDALGEVLAAEGSRNRWLLEVGSVARPLIGRLRVSATFPDGESKTFHEGDLADAAADLGAYTGYYVSALGGPFGSIFESADAALEGRFYGSEAEQRLFHLDELKKALPRDSSALVLIANPQTCDAMVAAFLGYGADIIRLEVGDELQDRLETIQCRVAEELRQAGAEGTPASP